jgi:hypothetical protein
LPVDPHLEKRTRGRVGLAFARSVYRDQLVDHPLYKSGPTKEDESRFRYIFKHPNDDQREIIITLMLFDMPKPST